MPLVRTNTLPGGAAGCLHSGRPPFFPSMEVKCPMLSPRG